MSDRPDESGTARQMIDKASEASRLLKALSNEYRLIVMCYLTEGERSVSELEQLVGLSQSALSQHLARLRQDGLVRTRRSAQTIYYALASDKVTAVMETLYGLYCAPAKSDRRAAEMMSPS